MKAALKRLGARYAAYSPRERAWVFVACLAVVGGLGQLVWVEPQWKRRMQATKQIGQHESDLASLRVQMDAMRAQKKDPNVPVRAQLDETKGQSRTIDQEFARLQSALVPPQEMASLVEQLIKRHGGLQLKGMRTLPVVSVDDMLAATQPAAKTGGANEADKREPWLYRHGLEISVQGSYADMLAYLNEIERMPRRVYWGDLKLDAQFHPLSAMTVTVYTISLERTWLVL
jgi:MSHA biogenesis protein MshJ